MKKNFSEHKFIKFFIVFLFSCVCAFYGLSLSYHSFITPSSSIGEFKDIKADGWITNESKIEFQNLNEKGNRLSLFFKSWRPNNVPSDIVVKVCGEKRGEFLVDKDDEERLISLNGTCNPRVVEFEVKNPIKAGANDSRLIGSQLSKVVVSSKLKGAIVSNKVLVITSIMIFALSVVTYYAWLSSFSIISSFIVPILSCVLLYLAKDFNLIKAYSLWTFLFWIFLGVAFSRTLLKQRKFLFVGDEENNTNIFYSILILVIVIAGAMIRYYGIDFGLPFNFHPDEVPKVNAIERMYQKYIQGIPNPFNPEYFLHPTLLLYCTYIMGAILRHIDPSVDFREITCLAGRLVSFIAGSCSIYLVYYIARRLFTPIVGIIAGLFLAFSPLHITCSRYLKEDALLVFFFLASVAFMIKAVKDDKVRYLFVSAIMAGLSCGVKYTGILSFAIIGFAPFFRAGSIFRLNKKFFLCTPLAMLLIPITFMCVTPYSVINNNGKFLVNDEGKISLNERFVKDFNSEKNHAEKGHTVVITANSEFWMYHFRESIKPNFLYPFLAIILLGVGYLIKRRRIEDLTLLFLIALFYLPIEYVKSKPAPQPERYILPCIPFLAIAGAEFIRVVGQIKNYFWPFLLFCFALYFPVERSVKLAKDIKPDTRILMGDWIRQNIQEGKTVCIDWKRYGPYLPEDKYNVQYVLRAKIMPKLAVSNLKKEPYDYLVLSSLFYGRYFSQPGEKAIREQFRRVFKAIPIVKEIKAETGSYGFHNPTLTLFSLKKEDIQNLEKELELKRQGKIKETSNDKKTDFFKKTWNRW